MHELAKICHDYFFPLFLCPRQLINLDVSNFEYLFWFFPLRQHVENNNKYSKFKIQHILICLGYYLIITKQTVHTFHKITKVVTNIFFVLINEEFMIHVITSFGGSFCHSASQRRSTKLAFLKGFFKKAEFATRIINTSALS